MHIDLNAFFASAEQLRDPQLKGKPVVVGGYGRRGVVSTASYEARAYGVHSAMPMHEALRKCPDLIVRPPDFHYYEILSNSFFAYLRRYSSLVEPASIDEGYVDMTARLKEEKEPMRLLKEIQDGLLSEIGLPCSIGIGPTKFLAKMASDMKKPLGITVLRRRDLAKTLYSLPVSDFFGIGRKSVGKLKELFHIETIGDLKKATDRDDPELIRFFGKSYYEIKEHVNGYGSDVISTKRRDPKSIGRSLTLEQNTNDFEEISAILENMANEIMSEARREKKIGRTIEVTMRDPDFVTRSKSMTPKEPISNEFALFDAALSLYRSNFLGAPVRLVGLTLQNLYDPKKEDIQMSLWNYEEYEEQDKTKLLIAELNRKMEKKYDKNVLMRGSEVRKDGD